MEIVMVRISKQPMPRKPVSVPDRIEARQELILFVVRRWPSLTADEIHAALGTNMYGPRTVYMELRTLREKKLVMVAGNSYPLRYVPVF